MPADPAPGSLAQKDASTLGNMLCRDYLRGVCYRGESCKFLHSEQHAPPVSNQLPVCRDYQNGTCNRRTCKYAHIYSASGFYDPQTMTAIPQTSYPNRYMQDIPVSDPNTIYYPVNDRDVGIEPILEKGYEEIFKTRAGPNDPLCKDFQNGYCQRGELCRYRHVSYLPDEQPNYHTNINRLPPSHVFKESPSHPYSAINDPPSLSSQPPLLTSSKYHATNNYTSISPTNNSNDRHYNTSAPSKRPHLIDKSEEFAEKSISISSRITDSNYEYESLRNEISRLHDELLKYKAENESLKDELTFYRYSTKNNDPNNNTNSHHEDISNHRGSRNVDGKFPTNKIHQNSSHKYYNRNASSNYTQHSNFPSQNKPPSSSSNHKPMYNNHSTYTLSHNSNNNNHHQ